jgi:hypothetical protein
MKTCFNISVNKSSLMPTTMRLLFHTYEFHSLLSSKMEFIGNQELEKRLLQEELI